MNPSTPPTPHSNSSRLDSLTVDIILADDRGETIVFPADPDALARFLTECRQQDPRLAPKTPESKS